MLVKTAVITSIRRKYEKNVKLWHSYVYPYAFVRMSSLAHISFLLYAHAYTCLSSEDHVIFNSYACVAGEKQA